MIILDFSEVAAVSSLFSHIVSNAPWEWELLVVLSTCSFGGLMGTSCLRISLQMLPRRLVGLFFSFVYLPFIEAGFKDVQNLSCYYIPGLPGKHILFFFVANAITFSFKSKIKKLSQYEQQMHKESQTTTKETLKFFEAFQRRKPVHL